MWTLWKMIIVKVYLSCRIIARMNFSAEQYYLKKLYKSFSKTTFWKKKLDKFSFTCHKTSFRHYPPLFGRTKTMLEIVWRYAAQYSGYFLEICFRKHAGESGDWLEIGWRWSGDWFEFFWRFAFKEYTLFFISTAIFWPRLICCLGIMKKKAQNFLNCCLVIYSGQNQKMILNGKDCTWLFICFSERHTQSFYIV